MRVAIFGDFPPTTTGGATVNYFLAQTFRWLGCDVRVHTHIAGMPPFYMVQGVTAHGGMTGRFDYNFVLTWLRNVKPDVAVLSGTWFIFRDVVSALAYHNIPCIAYIVAEGRVQPQYAGCLNYASKIFTPSVFAKTHLEKVVKQAEVVPHGIDVNLFKQTGEPQNYIFYPARLDDPRKQADKLIEAYRKKIESLKNYKLMFSGNPEPPEDLKDRIIGIGKHPAPRLFDMPQYYSMSNVVVFIGKAEGFGLPVIEGWACMRPVITLDTPPMNEIVTDKDFLVKVAESRPETLTVIMGGEKVPVNIDAKIADVDDLAEKLLHILNNYTSVAEKTIAWRRKVVKEYNYKENYMRICMEALNLD